MIQIKNYFYNLLYKYISVYCRPNDIVVEIDPQNLFIIGRYPKGWTICTSKESKEGGLSDDSQSGSGANKSNPAYVLLNGAIHYQRDIQAYLCSIYAYMQPDSRLIITYYSRLWQPFITLATLAGLRDKTLEQNWITPDDMVNFLDLADFEPVLHESKVIFPIYIPLLSNFLNRFVAPLPFFKIFCMVNIVLARPLKFADQRQPSVSVIVIWSPSFMLPRENS